jgi:hypothetical protein
MQMIAIIWPGWFQRDPALPHLTLFGASSKSSRTHETPRVKPGRARLY